MPQDFFNNTLVSEEYGNRLHADLEKATVCRFLVAYISKEGLKQLYRPLVQALSDERSFGVSSLTCSCGYKPLLNLQYEFGDEAVRLKYFMDPKVKGKDEPSGLSLFHSKLVYLYLKEEQKSVVYIGSHNWSSRALGPGPPRNAEASMRLEYDFDSDHLSGFGDSIPSQVNRHLRQAWELPACFPATTASEQRFVEWTQFACKQSPPSNLERQTIVLAVRTASNQSTSHSQLLSLVNESIYLQMLEEDEGGQVWDAGDTVLILVWNSISDLQNAYQPTIIVCRKSTQIAGPESERHGTNQSASPIVGFRGVLFDENQHAAWAEQTTLNRNEATIWNHKHVEYFDFEFPSTENDSEKVDAPISPKYQFHLEVEAVALPEDSEGSKSAKLVWSRASFAVAKSKQGARFEKVPGYAVKREIEKEILSCFREVLNVDISKAKVLPTSDVDQSRIGKRFARHELHDTFLGADQKGLRDELYLSAPPGALLPEIDPPKLLPQDRNQIAYEARFVDASPIERVQRLFTAPVGELKQLWARSR